ncbi:TetR/AcrR family transcriptional regulator [Kiloniella laminariae]|uniref:TetR/AcrR family transcriptional regulator n=1 Tax=Kiloniella laminariae TaxID=454162 RepID=UPI0003612A62|nr:TetR family transcriptional regulator C-terminal domain-containing protein [Kiloniella laminariae]
MTDTPKFRRQIPEERKKEMVEATLRCLGQKGSEGLSVRNISAEAGISIGLINHHYPSKDDLVAAAYEKLATDLLHYVVQLVEQSGGTPRERMSAFFRGYFSSEILDQKILRVWVVFWNMSEKSEKVRQSHDRTYAGFRAQLEQMLCDLVNHPGIPDFNHRLAAIGLSAMLDGLWLEWCLNPATFAPEEGLRICEAWVDGLVSGAFDL